VELYGHGATLAAHEENGKVGRATYALPEGIGPPAQRTLHIQRYAPPLPVVTPETFREAGPVPVQPRRPPGRLAD